MLRKCLLKIVVNYVLSMELKKKKGGLKLFSELSFIPATFLIVTFRYLNYTVKFLRTKNSSLFIFV